MSELAERTTADNRSEEQRRIDIAEAWALLESMQGMWTGQLEQYGGAEEFARKIREEGEWWL